MNEGLTTKAQRLKESRKIIFTLFFVAIISPRLYAADFQLEKQKLKLSLEYENFVNLYGGEVRTSGLRISYLGRGKTTFENGAIFQFDLQSGIKSNFVRDFESGQLSPLMWSNRATSTLIIPVGKFYTGGSVLFRNKWLADAGADQFVDVFGGEGFHELTGSFLSGYKFNSDWETTAAVHHSDVHFSDYPLSNYNWTGASIRISRRFEKFKAHADFRIRFYDYERPVLNLKEQILTNAASVSPLADRSSLITRQQDVYQDLGVSLEFFSPFYVAGGYSYQDNDSNNPGFGYHNHRLSFILSVPLGHEFFFQAYGVLQRQDFFQQDEILTLPLLVDENDNNSMAASLMKDLGKSRELEFGFQRVSNYSSFDSYNVSKYVLFAAFNYRF